jgi:flagellar basal-body rod protein FlgB
MLPIGDVTTSAIYEALQGLTARQDAIAQNVANVDTPGYKAEDVSFEQSLAQAVADGDPAAMQINVTTSSAAPDSTGNNVDLASEEVDAQKTGLAYQTMIAAMNAKMSLLETAISGQSG